MDPLITELLATQQLPPQWPDEHQSWGMALVQHVLKQQEKLQRLQQHLMDQEQQHTQDLLDMQQQLQQQQQQHTTDNAPSINQEEEVWEEEKKRWQEERDHMSAMMTEYRLTISNLETAVETYELTKKTDVDIATAGLEEQLNQVQTELNHVQATLNAVRIENQRLQVELDAKEHRIRELEHERGELLEQQQKQRRRSLQAGSSSSEMAARPQIQQDLMANLLRQFFAVDVSDPGKKADVLVLITKVLEMTDVDREAMGLERYNGVQWRWRTREKSNANDTTGSLADQWISFLVSESKAPMTTPHKQ